jgi:hypothetical protein
METLLPIDTEVQILKLGPQNTPYTGKTGRVVAHRGDGTLHVILDEDPIPRWRDMGVFCYPWEVRSIDDCE